VARYITNPDGKSCEFAIVVADDWQQKGIAHRLMQQLIETARSHSLLLMEGEVLTSNKEMLNLAAELGFSIASVEADRTIKHVSRRLYRPF